MKRPWAMLWVVAALFAAAPARADVTLVMIRHGEKPELGLGQRVRVIVGFCQFPGVLSKRKRLLRLHALVGREAPIGVNAGLLAGRCFGYMQRGF